MDYIWHMSFDLHLFSSLQNGTRSEFTLSEIKDLKSKKDIKVIIHGFIGNRFHYSIRPLGQGKANRINTSICVSVHTLVYMS